MSDLLSDLILKDLYHFPSKVDFNASFVTLLKENLIHIGEVNNGLVRGPVLNLGISMRSSYSLVLSEEMFVVERVEVCSFSFVRTHGRVADHISAVVSPAMVSISHHSLLSVDNVTPYLILTSVLVLKIYESLEVFGLVVESSVQN